MKKLFASLFAVTVFTWQLSAQQTQKPMLYGSSWMAITGKPMAATAGAMIFQQGGNAVDAACAMLAATCTMWDTLSWGGETQALIYDPQTKKVIAVNAMGVAPAGATTEFFKSKGYNFPPEYGPLAATTPGTPGGLIFMLGMESVMGWFGRTLTLGIKEKMMQVGFVILLLLMGFVIYNDVIHTLPGAR